MEEIEDFRSFWGECILGILKKGCYIEEAKEVCGIDDKLVKQRDSLVALAVQKGAKYREINDAG